MPDAHGTWYGFYHHERPADDCGRPDRQLPRDRRRPLPRSRPHLGRPGHRPRRAARHGGVRFGGPLRARRRRRRLGAILDRDGAVPVICSSASTERDAGAARRGRGAPAVGRSRRPGGRARGLERQRVAAGAVARPARRRSGRRAPVVTYPAGTPLVRADAAVPRRQRVGRRVLGPRRSLEHAPGAVRDAAQPRRGRALQRRKASTWRLRPTLDDPRAWSAPTRVLERRRAGIRRWPASSRRRAPIGWPAPAPASSSPAVDAHDRVRALTTAAAP